MSDDHVYLTLAEGRRGRRALGVRHRLHRPAARRGHRGARGCRRRRTWPPVCLALGDDALVSAQRLAEWCTRAPELEEEVALANIGLDLLGQARLLYARAGQADGTGRGEDAYAYFRDAGRLPQRTPGRTAGRRLRVHHRPAAGAVRLAAGRASRQLTAAPDPVLAAIAAKGVKELTYHRQYAAEWAVRLGDGTDESHRTDARPRWTHVAPWLGRAVDGPHGGAPRRDRPPWPRGPGWSCHQVQAGAGLDRCRRTWPRSARRRPRCRAPAGTEHTAASGAAAGRVAERGPRPPGGDMVTRRRTASGARQRPAHRRARSPTPSCPC